MRLENFHGVTPQLLEKHGFTGEEQLQAQSLVAKGQAGHRSNNQLNILDDDGEPTGYAVRATYKKKDGLWKKTSIIDCGFE